MKQYMKAANTSFEKGDYYSAAVYYRKVLDYDSTQVETAYKYAEACRLSNDYKHAERWYTYIYNKDKGNKYPLAMFWLGTIMKNNGKYKEAKKMFERYYRKFKKKETYYTEKAEMEIAACDYARLLLSDTLGVLLVHPDSSVNSVYTDFAPFGFSDSVLLFSSWRPETGNPGISKLYISQRQDELWSNAHLLDMLVPASALHTGNFSMSSDEKKICYSLCTQDSLTGGMLCELYMIHKNESGWQNPEQLNDLINQEGTSSTQPSMGVDSAGNEWLFFASNRTDGEGGMDIWYIQIKADGPVGKPQNAGKTINSEDDEITPFYHTPSHTLYFSSTWHKGLGGFDIFKTEVENGKWTEPRNLGFPFNTSANDLYFMLMKNGRQGYLASNRVGSYYLHGENCCNDIYYFKMPGEDSIALVTPPKPDIVKQMHLLVPLTLYFHNDEPDAKTLAVTTPKNYNTTLSDYLALIPKYKVEYAKGLASAEKKQAEEDIDDFFEDYVKDGFRDLEKFTALMLTTLEEGKTVIVTLKGYCSPLASTEYNVNLARRRISSLRNYFDAYGNGVLKPYISHTSPSGGKIEFAEEQIGELQANPLVSDNPNDQKNSVYSRAAALERKIQIIAVSVTD